MSERGTSRLRPMKVFVAPGSRVEQSIRSLAGLPGNATPRALAPGLPPARAHDLHFFGGRTIPNLRFLNLYIGKENWPSSDAERIDHALAAAMSDQRLNNVMAQYFPGQRLSSSFLGSRFITDQAPSTMSQGDVEALVTQLHDDGKLSGSDLPSTVFNLLLPPDTILTTDAAPSSQSTRRVISRVGLAPLSPAGAANEAGSENPAQPESQESSQQGLGGYHGSVHMQNGDTVYYAVGVYSQTSAGSSTNGIVAFDEPWKNVVATFYHELNEARTDPDVEDAIKAGNGGERFLGWMSTQGEECGDFPVFEDPSLSKVFVEVPLADGSGTVPVQLQYSNAVHGPEGPIASPHQAARRPSSTPLPSRGVGPSAQGQPGSPVRAVRVTTVVEVPLDGSQMAVGPNAGGDVSGIRERSAASVSGRKNIEAHLTTGGPISAALITGDDPNGTDFTGDPTDQTATIQTDEFGQLVWALDLDTQTPFTSWQLSLTEKGKTEGQPDASDTTDSSGHAVDSSGQNPGGIKQF